MPKYGVADYGINVWEGGCFSVGERLKKLKKIGFDGIEWLKGADSEEAFCNAVTFHKLGMDFTSCEMGKPELSLRTACAFGKKYVWIPTKGRDVKIDLFCRYAKNFCAAAKSYNVTGALHNHLGCTVENQDELEYFLKKVPEAGLLLDIGHLAGASGNCVEIVEKYFDRLVAVHFKGVEVLNKKAPLSTWWERYRLCGLTEDTIGIDFAGIVKVLKKRGYDKWLLVEHDTHIRDPYRDLAESLAFLQSLWQKAK
ncbi:MAG: sugar phosphate isomerase/epimerase [Victivallaceae bacterium]|nr:sugar phosphate isomerase/epimerase [Victivallaceae bacterium]